MTAQLTEPRQYIGAGGAAELNRTTPCTVTWCGPDNAGMACAWDFDFVGGAVTRLHGRHFPSGTYMSKLEFPPGEDHPEHDREWGVYLAPQYLDGDGLDEARARRLKEDLDQVLQFAFEHATGRLPRELVDAAMRIEDAAQTAAVRAIRTAGSSPVSATTVVATAPAPGLGSVMRME